MRAHDDNTQAKTCAGFNVFHRPKKMTVIGPRARDYDYVFNHLKPLVRRNVPSQFLMLVFARDQLVVRFGTQRDWVASAIKKYLRSSPRLSRNDAI